MPKPISFYAELAEIARKAYEEDRKRAVKETVSLIVCFALFMAVLWLAGALGMPW